MATTGCASAGSITLSPMKQLHALHGLACRSPPSMPLTHLNPITSTRHRLHLTPLLCGHGELEIVSVKELADGFLHFSFGAPPNASKVDGLASNCGEHFAGKLSVPRRLASKFSKKSPIPVAGMKRRKRQGESLSKGGPTELIPSSVKEPMKLSSRPKSSFVKRSPIPRGKVENVMGTEIVSNGTAVHDKDILTSQGTRAGSVKAKSSMRPTSKFVRKSPIPTSAAKHNAGHALTSAHSNPSPSAVSNASSMVQETSSVSASSRPKSNFSRRSPIIKAQHLPQKTSSTRRRSSPPTPLSLNDSGKVDNTPNEEANEKSLQGSPHLIADLEKCKLPELKNLAKIKGVKGYYKLKKGELLDLLKNLEG